MFVHKSLLSMVIRETTHENSRIVSTTFILKTDLRGKYIAKAASKRIAGAIRLVFWLDEGLGVILKIIACGALN